MTKTRGEDAAGPRPLPAVPASRAGAQSVPQPAWKIPFHPGGASLSQARIEQGIHRPSRHEPAAMRSTVARDEPAPTG